MFDIGWSELLIIAVVALVVIGPKELPATLRTIGKMTARARKMAGEFRSQFDEAMREAELDDVRQTISDAQKLNPVNSLREAMNPLRQMGNDIKADLQRSTTSDSPAATSTPAEPVSEPSMGLPETPPAAPAISGAPPVVAPTPVAAAQETPAKPKAVRKPRAKAPAKTEEVAVAVVDTPIVAEKPKRAPRKVAVVAPEAPVVAAPKKRVAAAKTTPVAKATPKKKDKA
ncbi:twin-arginine translocase subunit TatB [Agrobacterium rhizogenes]|uniref:Sec-independent protein translocase protein TatB n=2 Tax=Rhizobium rhizogenes TaxID=359 RepID=B9JEG9_RHIR8|nr:Sec-independent protein translocase protein TatB [Rhizobium rhizogenes]ACM26390.1 SEC-independent protein translocase protein [Rhizobium rhizogenes K84]KAA6490764.1 twin-arginine translocase subunit TatB [Agrobacterium sp. ICMP 7243]OCJ25475.1 twin arginine-targeting protein translocase TatB [Agrobacterium sp. B131/95]MDJ1632358.1 Sec-independent protein translocase protein TatB [Rhizobium rhizogenes]NTF48308.1 twin-arginine translocase subunit TatB [Rhizobium rhizogenes]